MNKINKFIVENRIIRAVLVGIITFYFIKVTLSIFSDFADLTTEKVAAYGIFCGLETLILKFYLQEEKNEIDRLLM